MNSLDCFATFALIVVAGAAPLWVSCVFVVAFFVAVFVYAYFASRKALAEISAQLRRCLGSKWTIQPEGKSLGEIFDTQKVLRGAFGSVLAQPLAIRRDGEVMRYLFYFEEVRHPMFRARWSNAIFFVAVRQGGQASLNRHVWLRHASTLRSFERISTDSEGEKNWRPLDIGGGDWYVQTSNPHEMERIEQKLAKVIAKIPDLSEVVVVDNVLCCIGHPGVRASTNDEYLQVRDQSTRIERAIW